MNEKLAEIEEREKVATPGPLNIHRLSKIAIVISNPIGMTATDLIFFANARADRDALFSEVRRLQAVVEVYANHDNWSDDNEIYYHERVWIPNEHGYTIAEKCLREDGE